MSWLRAQPLKGRVFLLIAALVGGGGLFLAALANCQPGHPQHAASNLASPNPAPTASEPAPPLLSTPQATTPTPAPPAPTPTRHSPLQVSITGGRQLWTAQGSGPGRSGVLPAPRTGFVAYALNYFCSQSSSVRIDILTAAGGHTGQGASGSGRQGEATGTYATAAPFMVAILAPATCTWYAGANG